MGDVGRYRFLGFIVSRDSFRGAWEVIQEGTVEVSFRWFRSFQDAEVWCMRKKDTGATPVK